MIVTLVRHAVLIAAAAAAVFFLVRQFGAGTAVLVWAGLSLLACAAGAVLLRTSAVGRITWKNRLAACLMPWGANLGGGALWPIPVTSWVVWLGVAGGVIALTPTATGTDSWPTLWRVALGTAWVIDGGVLLYVAGTLRRHYPPTSSGWRSLTRICVVLIGLIAASVVLYVCGLPYLALAVAGGPPLVAGVGYGLFLGTLIVFGRGRWN